MHIHADAPIGPVSSWIAAALGPDLVGLYAYGSVVSGGFEPGVSDLDLVAATRRDAAELDLDRVEDARRAFVANRPEWNERLEVVIIGAQTLRAFRTTDVALAVVSPGEPLHLSRPVRDWTQNWYLLRQTGVTLRGEDVRAVVPEVTVDEFLAAVSAYARWLAARDLDSMSPGSLAYAVLSECRALYTLRTGRPCSKVDAGAWMAAREPGWASLIDAALACRRAGGSAHLDDPATRAAATAFIRAAARYLGTGPSGV